MKANGILGMALAMAMMSEASFSRENAPREYKPNSKDFEPKPQKGQFQYWFRSDGTFLKGNKIENLFFTCFAINDKNSVKKFKSYQSKNIDK